MARTILVVPSSPRVGLTSAALGLLRALDERGVYVGFLKPLGQARTPGGRDVSAGLVSALTPLRPEPALPESDLEDLLSSGGIDAVLEEVVTRMQHEAVDYDVMVTEGLNPGPNQIYSGRVNQAMARALDADVVLVGAFPHAHEGTTFSIDEVVEHVVEVLAITAAAYSSGETKRVVGCVVNRAPTGDDAAMALLRRSLEARGLPLLAAIPYRVELAQPRVRDLVRQAGFGVLHAGDLNRRIRGTSVFAQAIPGGLVVLQEGELIVVPGDRHEVIMAASLAALRGVHLAALLFSTGVDPDEAVWRLCEPAFATGLPVITTGLMTYDAVTLVTDIDIELNPDDPQRAELVMENAAAAFDDHVIEGVLSVPKAGRLSPAAFRHRLVELARKANARIVLPEGLEPRTLQAAVECLKRGIARPVLLGDPEQVRVRLSGLGLDVPEGLEIIDPLVVAERYVEPLVRLRAHKNLSADFAREALLEDPITVGTMMVHEGEVDGLVSGAAHTTAATVRPALQILGTSADSSLVSSVFFMLLPDEVLVYGDCAINPNPTPSQLADIAISSAESARAFGIEPRVAMISFSTGESGAGGDVEKVAEATRLVRERRPDLAVDGPLQYDAASTRSVGKSKRPGSSVAGRATVFVFPDLDTGNTTYKAVQRSADVLSIGPMLQGLGKPVNDLSRGATVEDIVYTIAVTAVQAGALRSDPIRLVPPPPDKAELAGLPSVPPPRFDR